MAPEISESGNISPIDFLSNIYRDGAEPYFNAVGIHPYSYAALPANFYNWSAWSQISNTTPSLRSVMIANGDTAKQIWITEFGAPTGGPG